MMNKEIDSISISDFFWTQFKDNRVSFSFKGLPESIHFTIAWNKETGRMNLHITKNIGDGSDKPKFVIANFDKPFLDELMSFAPTLIFNKIFHPISFKRYSRRSRKNIQLIYLDEFENSQFKDLILTDLIDIWTRISKVKRRTLKINPELDNMFQLSINVPQMAKFVMNNMRNLTSSSFNSNILRAGIIFMGKKTLPFISSNGKCYAITKKMTINELLISFTNPGFADVLINYIKEALNRLPDAQSSADTLPYNRPYQLFIDKVG